MTLQVVASGRGRRTRMAAQPLTELPDLSPPMRELLRRWLASDASERQWDSLLQKAGREQLELADELLSRLLECGALRTKERFLHGQWRTERIAWMDVVALQRAVGLPSAEDRIADRDDVASALRTVAASHDWLEPAARSCLEGRAPTSTLKARAELLQAVTRWKAEQRFGLRRDFALYARGRTKAVSDAEWDWLDAHLPVEALGIARFAPLIWLGGRLGLVTPTGRVDVGACGFCGVPARTFRPGTTVEAPLRYWLIENRASFERQAEAAPPDTCVLWLPGQPSSDWLTASAWLLDTAPAAAAISCDPDPAGISIALTAGALWSARGLAWEPYKMSASEWHDAPMTALNDFDKERIAQLQGRQDLPPALSQLCADLLLHGTKAEQEHWI